MDTVAFISHRPFSQQAVQVLQNLSWQNEMTKSTRIELGCRGFTGVNSQGIGPSEGLAQNLCCQETRISSSGMVERGIQTCLMMNTGQNEK